MRKACERKAHRSIVSIAILISQPNITKQIENSMRIQKKPIIYHHYIDGRNKQTSKQQKKLRVKLVEEKWCYQ